MWTHLLLGLIYSILLSAKAAKTVETPLWIQDTTHRLLISYRRHNSEHMPELSQPMYEKRALTMFGRWGPINDFGKERSSIRSADRINFNTNRKLGQPFRWG